MEKSDGARRHRRHPSLGFIDQPGGSVWNERGQKPARASGHVARAKAAACGGNSGEDVGENGLPAGSLHLSVVVYRSVGTGHYRDAGFDEEVFQLKEKRTIHGYYNLNQNHCGRAVCYRAALLDSAPSNTRSLITGTD